MLELHPSQVQTGRQATDKVQVLAELAASLVADGLVGPGYLHGMQAREQQGSTYLGQGIAIPHGTPQTRDQVFQTGMRLIQYPEGVDWGDGQRVYLAIAIAARSDEHLRLLQLLTRALGEGDLSQSLREAKDAESILALLQGAPQELALDSQLIGLGVAAEELEELTWQGARLLKKAGCTASGFAASLLQNQPLPLGDGLWWLNSEQAVQRPGLAFVTPGRPLQHDGQTVAGLFCLASLGEEHRHVLERLCDLLIAGQGDQLASANSSRSVLAALGAELPPDWPTRRVTLANAHGLHARPAKLLSELAQGFDGEVRVRLADAAGNAVSVKSMSKLLALGARRGQVLEFSAEPGIAVDALLAIEAAVHAGLGEEVQVLHDVQTKPVSESALAAAARTPPVPQRGTRVQAVAASPGIARGPALIRRPLPLDYPAKGEGVALERQRLQTALLQVEKQTQQLIERTEQVSVRDIFVTHQAMLRDPELRADVDLRMASGASAEAAWLAEIEDAAARQEALRDTLLAERAADLRDVGRRVLEQLCGVEASREPEVPYILVMAEVGPSDVAALDRQRVAGIVTARGGATAHSSIIARALGIPCVVGAGEGLLALEQGITLLLNGERGQVWIAPDQATLDLAERERLLGEQRLARAHTERMQAALTQDGHAVEVAVNIGRSGETAAAVELGAEAVGLLRTELLFMDHSQAPEAAIQEAEYRRVLDALEGRPLVVRTLDVGGDKPLPYWPMPEEENPFLGVRGVRMTLQRPEIMQTQLRALLQAADGRPLRIMFPMVGQIEEWRAARSMVERLREEIPVADMQVGVMIEIPSAALLAPVLAREVDFFSIGTNDLTQYSLAIDRGHPSLSAQADGLHPAVLRLIEMTVVAAHAQGKWVGVCGELAADMLAVPLLVGLGVDELSVAARSIALVKARIRELDWQRSQTLAQRALTLESAAAVRALLEENY
jgi:phosphoenolpyruvate-protein phosphotransferase